MKTCLDVGQFDIVGRGDMANFDGRGGQIALVVIPVPERGERSHQYRSGEKAGGNGGGRSLDFVGGHDVEKVVKDLGVLSGRRLPLPKQLVRKRVLQVPVCAQSESKEHPVPLEQ
jgi:hypothetical protein